MGALRVIWVGKTERGFYQQAVTYYRERIEPFQTLECIEVRSAAHSGRDAGRAVGKESDAILKRIAPRDSVILLDEKGRQRSSHELAALFNGLSRGGGSLTLVLGGAYGVDERVRVRAEIKLSLSRLTFPHQLARVILLEQIYRSLTLRDGHGNHHD